MSKEGWAYSWTGTRQHYYKDVVEWTGYKGTVLRKDGEPLCHPKESWRILGTPKPHTSFRNSIPDDACKHCLRKFYKHIEPTDE